jgi:hypothetical protein
LALGLPRKPRASRPSLALVAANEGGVRLRGTTLGTEEHCICRGGRLVDLLRADLG